MEYVTFIDTKNVSADIMYIIICMRAHAHKRMLQFRLRFKSFTVVYFAVTPKSQFMSRGVLKLALSRVVY